MATVAPYGSWESPIGIDLAAGEGYVSFSAVDMAEPGLYWVEGRPMEKGRSVLVFKPHGGEAVDVVPADFNVRTRVHEYGGGAWWRHGEVLFCSSFDDSRLYRIDTPGAEPAAITPEPDESHALRYADGRVFADGRLIVCVREAHGDGEPRNELVVLPADGSTEPRVVASGRDFYAAPRPSPVHLADLAPDGSLSNTERVAGSSTEAVFQPDWSPEGALHFVSDRSGWWNPYELRDGEARQLREEDAEFGYPLWVLDFSRYAFLADGRIACLVTRNAVDSLELLDPQTGTLERVDLPFTSYSASIRSFGNVVALIASAPTTSTSVAIFDADSGELEVVRRATDHELDEQFLAEPEAIEFAGAGGLPSYGFYYPPANARFTAPEEELPPLVVWVHGGPTAHATTALDLDIQLLTSRGIAVVDVNYGGSTGYGREYRDRLRGRWGEVDVEDAAAAARHLASQGLADPARTAITGGSAGGYTTLLALALRDDFTAGISAFGVADLVTFHEDTHKFESRYDEYLVGPWPEARDLYGDRSPVSHADSISRPLLLLQGLDDKIVPPSQSEVIVQALVRRGIPYAYIAFEGEGHGFRKAENNRRASEAELSFLGQIFGFEPADDLEPVRIENLEGAPH